MKHIRTLNEYYEFEENTKKIDVDEFQDFLLDLEDRFDYIDNINDLNNIQKILDKYLRKYPYLETEKPYSTLYLKFKRKYKNAYKWL